MTDEDPATKLERYLHEHIPLSRAMGVSVIAAAPGGVALRAPLGPNINHRDTAFGGSVSALSILAAWSLLSTRFQAEGLAPRIVIQRNTMEYLRPVTGDLVATAVIEGDVVWQRFVRTFIRKGRARITVASIVQDADVIAGQFTGEFVALSANNV